MMAGAGHGTSVGAQATASWLRDRALAAPAIPQWHVEIRLGTTTHRPPTELDEQHDTRFHLDLYPLEWGVFFCHGGRGSWIRVADIAFVHRRDDFGLLAQVPPLRDIGRLLRRIEAEHQLAFRRDLAAIRTNLDSAEPAIRAWLATL